jgi:hypothetical protein
MPLYPHAVELIRENLEQISRGCKVKPIAIGRLTEEQLESINRRRQARNSDLPSVIAEVVFFGSHIYQSRCVRDGYAIDDVLDQIVSAMDPASVLIGNLPMQAIENPNERTDRYGNVVHDRAVFECMNRYPRPELFSVVPRGDRNRPARKQKGHP